MSALRYVCLSDLHLGAKYSVLSRIGEDSGENEPEQASRSLQSFARCLKRTVAPLADDEPPRLVLLGDVLEMAFAERSEVAMGFQRFLECMYPAGEDPDSWVLSPEIILVPGNHDHQLWNAEVDRHYLNQIEGMEPGRPLPELTEITTAFDEPQLRSRFLTGLMRQYPHLAQANARVVVAYPNLGLANEERCIVLHHGHYVEPLYRLMTELAAWFDGTSGEHKSIASIERENGSWVDFLWSSLGDAGGIRSDVLKLYEIMQDTAAMHVATSALAGRIVHQLRDVLPMSGLPDVRRLARRVTKGLLNLSVGRASQMERAAFDQYLTEGSMAGLRWYLENPVHGQLRDELNQKIPEEMTFVFGHTHKPFEEFVPFDYDRYRLPVQVLNTGGWVLDQPRQASTQGAAAVFIDKDLNAASLRLFNNTLSGDDSRVCVREPVGEQPDNPLLGELDAVVRAPDTGWAVFSELVHDALDRRAKLMSRTFFDPEANPPMDVSAEAEAAS